MPDGPDPQTPAPRATPPGREPARAEIPAGDRPAAGPNRRVLTAVLVVALLAIAGGVIGLLTRENDSNPVDDVSAALAAAAPQLSGPISVTELQHTRCAKQGGSQVLYTCTPVMDNANASSGVTVQWKGDVLTKRLAGTKLTVAPRSGNDVAAALDVDEQSTIDRTVKYGCAFSIGINPDGSSAASSPGGFRCATAKPPAGEKDVLQRYVEFAADGSVKRDFMLTGQ